MLECVFKTVLVMSASGGLIAAALMLFAPVTRRIFSPRRQYFIALVSVAFFILPISFNTFGEMNPQYIQSENKTALNSSKSSSVTDGRKAYTENAADSIYKAAEKENFSKKLSDRIEPIVPYSAVVWIVVALILLCSKIEGYIWFKTELYKNSAVAEKTDDFPERIMLRTTDMLKSPMLTGIIRPTLYMPTESLTTDEKTVVTEHELVHYRRYDIMFKWLVMLVKCVHWFNPIVYMLSAYIERECEASCDFEATRSMSDTDKKRYMHTLLNMVEKDADSIAFAAQMSAEKKNLKRRIAAVKHKKCQRRIVRAVSLICVLGLTLSGVYVSARINNAFGVRAISKAKDETVNRKSVLKAKSAVPHSESEKTDSDNTDVGKAEFEVGNEDDSGNDIDGGDITGEEVISQNADETLTSSSNEKAEVRKDNQNRTSNVEYSASDYADKSDNTAASTDAATGGEVNKPDRVYGIDLVDYNGEKPVIEEKYTSQNGCRLSLNDFKCDDNGEFYIGFKANMNTVMNIEIFDSKTHESFGGYMLPINAGKAYRFSGFDLSRKYDIEIKSTSGTDWKVEGVCYIYYK